jgi:hypothetical protein
MDFKQWLNEIRVPDDAAMRKYARGFNAFYVDANGNLVKGYNVGNSSWRPYFDLNRQEKRLTLHNIEPSSKQFKDIIKALIRYVPDIMNWVVDILSLSHSRSGKVGYSKSHGGDVAFGNVNRPVSSWMRVKDSNVGKGHLPEFLYHGTSTELWYEGIKNNGLLPRLVNKIGTAGSYGAGSSLSKGQYVYMAVHPDAATRSAAEQAASQHGGQALILRISTKGLDWAKFTSDEDFDKQVTDVNKERKEAGLRITSPAQISAFGMGSVAYLGKVPPSLIQPLLLGERKVTTRRISWHWKKFTDIERQEHPVTKMLNTYFENDRSISSSDTPYFYAMIDSGWLVQKERTGSMGYTDRAYHPTRTFTDAEVRDLIRKSTWVRTAEAINKHINDWGGTIKMLNYVPAKVDNKEHQKIVDMLLASKIYYAQNDKYITFYSYGDGIGSSIKLAKELHKHKMTFEELLNKMREIDKAYPDR